MAGADLEGVDLCWPGAEDSERSTSGTVHGYDFDGEESEEEGGEGEELAPLSPRTRAERRMEEERQVAVKEMAANRQSVKHFQRVEEKRLFPSPPPRLQGLFSKHQNSAANVPPAPVTHEAAVNPNWQPGGSGGVLFPDNYVARPGPSTSHLSKGETLKHLTPQCSTFVSPFASAIGATKAKKKPFASAISANKAKQKFVGANSRRRAGDALSPPKSRQSSFASRATHTDSRRAGESASLDSAQPAVPRCRVADLGLRAVPSPPPSPPGGGSGLGLDPQLEVQMNAAADSGRLVSAVSLPCHRLVSIVCVHCVGPLLLSPSLPSFSPPPRPPLSGREGGR